MVRTYTQPERSLDNGTDESAILSRGSSTSSDSPRPDHNSPAIARPVPPVAYAMFLELKEFVLARLVLPVMTCDIEADVANPRSGRRLATRSRLFLVKTDMIVQSAEGKPVGLELEVKKKKIPLGMVDMGRDSRRFGISDRQEFRACLGPRYHYRHRYVCGNR